MLKHYPYTELGQANLDWLAARHHFSFGQYHNPHKPHFGDLVVINDDIIQPQTGFAPHGHADMEIITYVRRGAITHKDSTGNEGRTTAGNVQVMSAGTGISHSEFNHEDEETNIYQIWIMPRNKGITPRWDTAEFPDTPVTDTLPLLVSGDGTAPLSIHQDARIYAGRLTAGTEMTHHISGQAYLLVSEGALTADGQLVQKGDGIAISGQDQLSLVSANPCEILIIEVPGQMAAR